MVRESNYEAYKPLYHLIPLRILRKYELTALKKGIWPPWTFSQHLDNLIPNDFDNRVSKAFAHFIWPLLDSGSRMKAFSKDYPIVLLAHNLNFWLPYAVEVVENRLKEFDLAPFENNEQKKELHSLRNNISKEIIVDRPRCGGSIWCGEDDAWSAANEIIKTADCRGRLKEIINAIRSNRVEDDFSPLWSYAKEDFERKLYHKRSKVRVTFIELDNTIPVHAPTSELHEKLLWEDFLALLAPKERRIVICLKNGITKVGEISELLGYANHSPISKYLSRIREKAKYFLNI